MRSLLSRIQKKVRACWDYIKLILLLVLCVAFVLVWNRPNEALDLALWAKKYAIQSWNPPKPKPGPRTQAAGHEDDDVVKRPPGQVLVTFDDGDETQYEESYPVMQEHQIAGTICVIIDRIGDYKYMTYAQIREVQLWGYDLCAHTHTHRLLTDLTYEEAAREIGGSREALKALFMPGVDPVMAARVGEAFASPEGGYDPKVHVKLYKQAGYKVALKGWGAEGGKERNVIDGFEDPHQLVRFNVGNYHTAKDVCDAAKKIVGKNVQLILMYHKVVPDPEDDQPEKDKPGLVNILMASTLSWFGVEEKKRGSTKSAGRPKEKPDDPFRQTEPLSVAGLMKKRPPLNAVFRSTFGATMKCLAELRDKGDIQMPRTIPEGLEYYRLVREARARPSADREPEPRLTKIRRNSQKEVRK